MRLIDADELMERVRSTIKKHHHRTVRCDGLDQSDCFNAGGGRGSRVDSGR